MTSMDATYSEALAKMSGLQLSVATSTDLWVLVDMATRIGDDFAALVHLEPTLAECRTMMHQYQGVRDAIFLTLEHMGIDSDHGHGDPASVILRQGQAFVEEFLRNPGILLASDIYVNDEGDDGFVYFALTEYTWCSYKVEFMT